VSKELTTAVVQDALSGRVLMVGWMDAEALARTLETGEVHFWSRSRQRLWKKGDISGNVLRFVELKADCDKDTLLVRALPAGPTCHTGSRTCFGSDGKEPSPSELDALEQTIAARLAAAPGTRSYLRSLIEAGATRVGEKIVEEAGELAVEIARDHPDRARVVAEAADLLFHALVGIGSVGVTLREVEAELSKRSGVSGLDEKAARGADERSE
jgi:phosphoribosyl-ATP pyrophosphohydrolase/phosphoribosyl-AMP cyclohydrolase